MHFPESSSCSSFCAVPLSGAGPALAATAGPRDPRGRSCPLLPVAVCLMTSLSSLLRPAARPGRKAAAVAEAPEAKAP